ncbi:hypothetical protein BpHYR1_034620 [Brachionus plicatilis]|uniref:Uncharacterized protein n=1 Tax=Brachionus plicatilis TaxID=10195 RepID=A0A3M7T094_BRAPC|nr:hypothetical protein BpHYR1_034620 [Brachionus plicatilis]
MSWVNESLIWIQKSAGVHLELEKFKKGLGIFQIDEGFYTGVRKQIIDRLTFIDQTQPPSQPQPQSHPHLK